jgi:hypothetical protein
MKLWQIAEKFLAVAALMALLVASVPTLAESLSASNLPACCNTAYCPLHHRQMSDLQKDRKNCDSMGIPGNRDCSMRACDAASNAVMGTALFVFAAPLAVRYPASAEPVRIRTAQFFPSIVSNPLTPPPRTLPS